jgi:hypothetical protein
MQGSPGRPPQSSPERPPLDLAEEERRDGDADDEIANLLSTSQVFVAVPPVYEDAEEEAEVAMMREGLAKSQQTDLRPSARSPAVFARKGSLFFSSAADLLGPAAAAIAPKIDELELAEFTVLVRSSIGFCLFVLLTLVCSLRRSQMSTTPSARAPRRC